MPVVRAPAAFFDRDPPERRLRPRALLVPGCQRRPGRPHGHLRVRWRPELRRLLPAARHARPRPGRPHPRRRPARPRPEPSRRAAGQGRARHPALPDPVAARATRTTSGTSSPSSGQSRSRTRRTGGSSASARRGDRRLAPRRLGSGRRGRADAARGRHGRLRRGPAGARLPQPALATSAPRDRLRSPSGSSAARSSRRRSTSARTSRGGRGSSRASTFTTTPPFTLTYHIRPEARWSDGVPVTARGLRLHAPGDPRASRRDDRCAPDEVRSVRAVDSKTVEVVLRSRFADWRELFGIVLPRHALEGEDLANVWTDRIDNPKTGGPIGSGPFLVERWERGRQITLVRNPRYWGPILPTSTASSFASGSGRQRSGEAFRSGELDVASHFPPGFVAAARSRSPACGCSRSPVGRLGALRDPGRPGRPPGAQEQARPPGARLRHRPRRDRPSSSFGDDRPSASQRDSARLPDPEPLLPAELEQLPVPPGRGAAAARAGGLPARRGRHLRLRRRAALASLRDDVLAGGFRPRVDRARPGAAPARSASRSCRSYAPGDALFGQILAERRLRRRALRLVRPGRTAAARRPSSVAAATHNFTGYCQRLVTRDLDQAERILDADQRARVLNRADAQMAKDVPVIPLFQQTRSAALRSTLRNFGLSLIAVRPALERGELVARGGR